MGRSLLLVVAVALVPARAVLTTDVAGVARIAGKAVEDAVVWIDVPGDPTPSASTTAVLTQREMQFFPHVLAVQVGTHVKFPNQDRVFHNVFSFHDGRRFDLGLYPVGMVKEVPFDRPGLSRVFCNIHPQMAAYVMVVDTPHFAVSDRDGHFAIAGVPVVPVRYHAWRPGGEILNGQLDLSTTTSLNVTWP